MWRLMRKQVTLWPKVTFLESKIFCPRIGAAPIITRQSYRVAQLAPDDSTALSGTAQAASALPDSILLAIGTRDTHPPYRTGDAFQLAGNFDKRVVCTLAKGSPREENSWLASINDFPN